MTTYKIIFVIFLTAVISGFTGYSIRSHLVSTPPTEKKTVKLDKPSTLTLKALYFDDFEWKTQSGDSGSGESKYSPRSIPGPVIHPIELLSVNDYKLGSDEIVNSRVQSDTDGDGKKEEIFITSNKLVNHPPHNAYISKNGSIFLHIPLQNGSVEPVKNGTGFYVKQQNYDNGLGACCPGGYRVYRVIFEDNSYKPVWEQDVEYLKVEG